MEFDFSFTTIANDNQDFMIRMRFDSPDMTMDNSDEVITNNIAVSGGVILSTDNFENLSTIKVYPNPVSNVVKIETSDKVNTIALYNIYG